MRKATGQWTQQITIGICILALLSGSGGQLAAAVEGPRTAQDPGPATPDAVTLYLTPVFRGAGPESISVASCQSQTATTADGALDISCPGAARRELGSAELTEVADTAGVELARHFEYERFFSPAMLPPLPVSDTPLLAFDLSLWDGAQPVPNPTFNPPLVLTMHYAQADVPPGANERLLQVRWVDEDTGSRQLLVVATAGSNGDRALYNGFPANQSPTNVILAPVYKNNFGFDTVFGVQNAGANNTTITCRFESGATLTQNNVPPGRSLVANLGSLPYIPDGFAGAVTCSGSSNASLRGAAFYFSANGGALGGFGGGFF